MAFRTIFISNRSKLEYSLGYLVIKQNGDNKRILISEIDNLIVESTMSAITTSAIVELAKNKVNIIFCDEKHNPFCCTNTINSSYNSFKKLDNQIKWDKDFCDLIWNEIVQNKLIGEYETLLYFKQEDVALKIKDFSLNIHDGDCSNREGVAAKIYFKSLFGDKFIRNNNDVINEFLNYGYSLIVSSINRFITSLGYLTQLGIHHKNEGNQFNLSYDLIEPFRVFVDQEVKNLISNGIVDKNELINLFNKKIRINGKEQFLNNALYIYINSVFSSLSKKKINELIFPDNYVF